METVTLAEARGIASAIDSYGKTVKAPDLEDLIEYVSEETDAEREAILKTLEFLQEVHGKQLLPAPAEGRSNALLQRIDRNNKGNLELATEISFNYSVAKALLELEMESSTRDNEELRKNLREISKLIEAALKMQERVFNVQQIQKFQQTVFEVLEEVDEEAKAKIVAALLEADL